jgi:hypothetical protein
MCDYCEYFVIICNYCHFLQLLQFFVMFFEHFHSHCEEIGMEHLIHICIVKKCGSPNIPNLCMCNCLNTRSASWCLGCTKAHQEILPETKDLRGCLEDPQEDLRESCTRTPACLGEKLWTQKADLVTSNQRSFICLTVVCLFSQVFTHGGGCSIIVWCCANLPCTATLQQ